MSVSMILLISSTIVVSSSLNLKPIPSRPHETELRPYAGSSWGSWGDSEFCPDGSWAAGFQLLHEPDCGDICDDTELNGVKLFCVNKDGAEVGEVTSKIGGFGGWKSSKMCDGYQSFISGIQFKSERETKENMSVTRSRSRHLDETAGNNVNMACSHGSVLAGDGGHYGDWSDFEICPENTAVCGIRTLVEDPQGIFTDDTALNQIILYCCDVLL